jgi:mRNA (guanine-N7-)-methyltransferase
MGDEEISVAPPEDTDTYYANTKTRNESETLNMNNFHNIWIKERLLKLAASQTKGKSLLDLGCGKGGDLHKWYGAGFETVIGFDQSRDNITNPKNGVYARMLQDSHTYGKKQYIFLPFDVRRPLEVITHETYPDEQELAIAKHIWGQEELKILTNQKIPYGIATRRFEVVSCQFAIHYFFQDDITLDIFCKNVANNLKPGGLFFATCFDGDEVNKLFKGGLTRAEGKSKLNPDKNLWAIEKHYDMYDAKTGQEIRVFVETINQYISEYLVDKSLLLKKMAEHGLELDKTQLFGETRSETLSKSAKDAASKMSDSEKAFSNLNRYYIFRKTEP